MNNKKNINMLFDTISWESSTQLNKLIDNMDDEQVRFLIIKALECSFTRGSFTLIESEIVSKLIRKISYQENVDNEEKKE
jgi:hypothetical protein